MLETPGSPIKRRAFIQKAALACAAVGTALLGAGCDNTTPTPGEDRLPLPPSDPDPDSEFGVDRNINIDSIDQYLQRSDVAYRDLRLFLDSAEPRLEDVLAGFKIVPYPYLASLPRMSFAGDYQGEKLVSLEFGEAGAILSSSFNYIEAEMVLADLFPKDRALFLVCGGGGFSMMAKRLLVHLGWDADRIYNLGGMRAYRGYQVDVLTEHASQVGQPNIYATWRADYATIDFSVLHKVK